MTRPILIIEDDADISESLKYNFEREGLSAVIAPTGEAGLAAALNERDPPRLIILDLMLPGMNGIELCRRLRREPATRRTPIIMLTAKASESDRVTGLDLGADDYITKPFELAELEARVRALIRRGHSGGGSVLTHGALSVDTVGRRALLNGEPLDLSARELGVLEVLMMRSGRVVNKEKLAEQLYGWDEEVGANAIEVYVHRLRRKLEPAGVAIRTIRGLGYLLEREASHG